MKVDRKAEILAKKIVRSCVRDTFLEDLHAGKVPDSRTGDYSDVKVISPFGEIPWTELSRISDAEMKRLMKEVTNKVYTVLTNIENEALISALPYPPEWDAPELDRGIESMASRAAILSAEKALPQRPRTRSVD